MKDLYKLKSQASELQKKLNDETVEKEKNGIKIVMNGNLEIISINIPSDKSVEEISSTMKDLVNETIKASQKLMIDKMGGVGGALNMLQ